MANVTVHCPRCQSAPFIVTGRTRMDMTGSVAGIAPRVSAHLEPIPKGIVV